jgi:hypothetical protein
MVRTAGAGAPGTGVDDPEDVTKAIQKVGLVNA